MRKVFRRDFIKRLLLTIPGVAVAQQMFHATILPTLVFYTTKTTGFHPQFTKTGATLYWKWPDGTYDSNNAPTKNLAAGTKRVEVQSQDAFAAVTSVIIANQNLTGALPSFAAFPNLVHFDIGFQQFSSGVLPVPASLTYLDCDSCTLPAGPLPSFSACTGMTFFRVDTNNFTGTLPSFAACTLLDFVAIANNQFSGALPSFAACTLLTFFMCIENNPGFTGALPSFNTCTLLKFINCYRAGFSGTLPTFAACTDLRTLRVGNTVALPYPNNQFSDVVAGSFATQKLLNIADFRTNALPQSAVDQILADFVVSLAIPGRLTCTLSLEGGTNAHPSAAGLANKALLVAAGWTVTNN